MLRRLKEKIKSIIISYKIKKGIIPRGRTSDKPSKSFKIIEKGEVTISAKLIKASGRVEDLGIIYQSKNKK